MLEVTHLLTKRIRMDEMAVWNLEAGDPPQIEGGVVSLDDNAQHMAQEIAETARNERAKANPLFDLTDSPARGVAYTVEAENMEVFTQAVKDRGLSTQSLTQD